MSNIPPGSQPPPQELGLGPEAICCQPLSAGQMVRARGFTWMLLLWYLVIPVVMLPYIAFMTVTLPLGLLGYTLIDEGKPIGKIDEVIEQPHQVLLQIKIQGKEALIPLHEETLVNIDHKKNEVHVTLPEGLLEIYLQ